MYLANMRKWLFNNGFFYDDIEAVWFSVGHLQQFKARLDESFNPHYIDIYIPWGKRGNEDLWRNIGGSKNVSRLDFIIQKFNVPIGSKIKGDIQPIYLAI